MVAGTEIAIRPPAEMSLDFTADKVELLKRTICRGVSDDELELFTHICKRTGLDPFAKQIHAVKRRQKNDKDEWVDVMTVQTGIDGYRLIADRTDRYMPGREPTFTYDDDGYLLTATAYVKKLDKRGEWHEIAATAHWPEYVGTNKDGSPNKMWSSKQHVMLTKCAEALALRRAFPAELSGVYTREEMDQAGEPLTHPQPQQRTVTPSKPVQSTVVQQQQTAQTDGGSELADDDVMHDRWVNAARDRGVPAKLAAEFLAKALTAAASKNLPVETSAWRTSLLANLAAGKFDDNFAAIQEKLKAKDEPKPEKKPDPTPAAAGGAEASQPAASVLAATKVTEAASTPTTGVAGAEAGTDRPAVAAPSPAPVASPIVNNTKPVGEPAITAELVAKWDDFMTHAIASAVNRGITAEVARAGISLKVMSLGKKGKENDVTVQTRLMLLQAIRASAFDFAKAHVDRTKLAMAKT